MSTYIAGFKNPFKWYKNFLQGLSTNGSITINSSDFLSSVEGQLDVLETAVVDYAVWNRNQAKFVDNVASMYKSTDLAHQYLSGLIAKFEGPIKKLETSLYLTEAQFRTQTLSNKITNSNTFSITPSDVSTIEHTSSVYDKYPLLSVDGNTFVLKDNGYASVIRSLNGYSGQITFENTISNLFLEGSLENCIDGSSSTFFLVKSFVPSLITTSPLDVSWVPSNYKHGALVQLSMNLNSQALINEIFLDPVSTEPFQILGVSWSSKNAANITPTYPSTATLTAGTVVNGSAGLTANSCLEVTNQSYAYNTVALPTNVLVTAGGAVKTSRRVDFKFYTRADGSSYSGIRIIWLNASSVAVGTVLFDSFTTSFYELRKYSAYAPPQATQFTIQYGVFKTPSISTKTYISDLQITLGEEYQQVNQLVTSPVTIKLAKNILTDRVSILINQTNIKRAVKNIIPIDTIDTSSLDLLPSTQNYYKPKLVPPDSAEFCYTFGFREIDLRYREHVPRGGIVTKKLDTRKEIRKLWTTFSGLNLTGVNISLTLNENKNSTFDIKPFNLDSSQTGDIFEIRTQDEVNNLIYNKNAQTLIINPIKVTESYDGTDREGKIDIIKPVHLKKYKIREVQNWLDAYSIAPVVYDPNTINLVGTVNTIQKNNFRAGLPLTPLTNADIITRDNYIPITVKITSDNYNANPDTVGQVQASVVRTITAEKLVQVATTSDTYQQSTPTVSFTAWLGQTSIKKAVELATQYQFKTVLEDLKSLNNSNNTTLSSLNLNQDAFRKLYDKLKVDNRLTLAGSKQGSTLVSKSSTNTYSTSHYPIIAGQQGSFIRVWLNNPTTSDLRELTNSEFNVLDYSLGIIEIVIPLPVGFTEVFATYSFFSSKSKEDFNSYISSNLVTSSTLDGKTFATPVQRYPITRNVTDYLNGSIPVLKKPNFNELSPDYYPVIEYYQTSDNQLIFSEVLYKYGDNPAKIEVIYETLNIQPSLLVTVVRDGSYVSSPQITSINLHTKETQAINI